MAASRDIKAPPSKVKQSAPNRAVAVTHRPLAMAVTSPIRPTLKKLLNRMLMSFLMQIKSPETSHPPSKIWSSSNDKLAAEHSHRAAKAKVARSFRQQPNRKIDDSEGIPKKRA
jgi:hypothetical protein